MTVLDELETLSREIMAMNFETFTPSQIESIKQVKKLAGQAARTNSPMACDMLIKDAIAILRAVKVSVRNEK